MKTLLLLVPLAFAASAGFAEPTAPAASAAIPATGPPDEIICRMVRDTGSRLSRSRICATRQQWEEQHRVDRQSVEHTQTNRIWCERGAC